MGRSYREELAELRIAKDNVSTEAVLNLREQAALAAEFGLIVVASGGAKVTAEWACRLQRIVFGSSAVAITPLDYAALSAPVRAVTWFLSAGGKHPDILHAAEVAKSRGDARVVGLIGHRHTPLGDWLKAELKSEVIFFDLPASGDGFLATTSVWTMANALARAYEIWLSSKPTLDGGVSDEALVWGMNAANASGQVFTPERDSIVLHDIWAALGANDLETRFIETALGNVWATDFRNFGHGRHFWVDDRRNRTTLYAVWTPASDALAEATLHLLPHDLPSRPIRIPFDGLAGALAALSWSIHLTANQAESINRDPGQPGVRHFGEKLYDGGFPYPRVVPLDPVPRAIAMKSTAIQPGTSQASAWTEAYWRARGRFEMAKICAIVVDYDGTLVDSAKRYEALPTFIVKEMVRLLEAGVVFGVATGRGDSVQKELRRALPEILWPKVILGYHNGATVLSLDNELPDLDGEPITPPLSLAWEVLKREIHDRGLAKLRCSRNQLTITPPAGLPLLHAWRATRECLDRNGLGSICVWLSSHSVDVLGDRCSKINVVSHVAKLAGCLTGAVLRIGDRGARPGNDWELLAAPLGFSVGDCSSDMETCWNLLPQGVHGAEGTAYLLSFVKTA